MPYVVLARVTFTDAQEKRSVETYRLNTELADDHSNMDAVMDEVAALEDGLAVMSAAAVGPTEVCVVSGREPGTPNEFADVHTYAFVRVEDNATALPGYYRIPSPDMLLYEANADGVFKDAFQAAWATQVAPYVSHPLTGDDENYSYAQLRYRRRRRRLS